MAKRYWLFKSEPNAYSLDDLEREGTGVWDGVRNYQARNTMRDDMSVGDGILFYHSNARPSAVVGLAEVARTAVTDPSAFDPDSPYFDPKSDPAEPRWITVAVRYRSHLQRPLPLAELREDAALADMVLLKKGMRLSVQPVTAAEWKAILARARKPAPPADPRNSGGNGGKAAKRVPRPRAPRKARAKAAKKAGR